jgi:type I restriction enzyme S subunit
MPKRQSKIEKLIAGVCPEGVEFKELGEVCVSINAGGDLPDNYLKGQKIPSDEFPYPIFSNGTEEKALYGFTDCYKVDSEAVTISARGTIGYHTVRKAKFTPIVRLLTLIANTEIITSNFLNYILDITEIGHSGGSIPQLTVPNVKTIKIPIPPLAIQQEIVKILDTFTALEAELEAELEARKKQYEYYRDELLTFGEDVEWKTLGEVYEFQYGEGNTIPTSGGEYPVYGSNGIVGSHSKYNSENAPVIGHIGAYAGIVNWASGKHFVTYNGVICRIIKDINHRFGYHLLKKQNLRELAKDGSQPFVSYDKLKSVKVQVPNNDKQIEVARLLDKFDALVNDISVGLPAELNARRKQYEYYRNKLLTFKPLEKDHASQ